METILEDNLLRHFQLITYLAFKDWLPIAEVSAATTLSTHTIQKDIGEINTYIAPAKIETSLKLGIRIELPADYNTFYVFSQMLRESVNFLILEEIFLHDYEKIIDLADKLFMSDSTLKRKIYKINKVLAPLNFQINPLHMDISGDEQQITWFFACYLIEKYTVLDALVPGAELNLLNRMLNEFLAAFPEINTPGRQNFSYRNRTRIALFVHLKRLERQHAFNVPKDAIDSRGFAFSTALQQQIHTKYHVSTTPETLFCLFFQFFNPDVAWSEADFAKKIQTNPTTKEIATVVDTCLTEIEDTVAITIPNKSLIRVKLYNKLVNTLGQPRILFLAAREFFMNVNDYYCSFTSAVNVIMQKHFRPLADQVFIDDDEITMVQFKLVTAWQDLGDSLEKRAPVVSAGLLFNTNYDHTEFVMRDVLYHLKTRLNITIVDAETIASIKNSPQKYDMIITNLSSLALPNLPVVSIRANPTAEDLTAILAQYNRIINRKVDADSDDLKKTNSIFA